MSTCLLAAKSSLFIPAQTAGTPCRTPAYTGFMFSERRAHFRSDSVCVDSYSIPDGTSSSALATPHAGQSEVMHARSAGLKAEV